MEWFKKLFGEKQAASLYEDDIAISIIKEIGKNKTKEIIEEEQVENYLHKNYPGVKFTLSELDEIESQIKKKLKPKKKKAEYGIRIGDTVATNKGQGLVISVPTVGGEVEVKLSNGTEEIFLIKDISKIYSNINNTEIGVEGNPEMGYGGHEGGVMILPGTKMDLQSSIKLNANNKFIIVIGEKVSKEFDTFEEAVKEKQAAAPNVPKPTDIAPDGFIWAWDEKSNSWILVTKRYASAEELRAIGSKHLQALVNEKWPGEAKAVSVGYAPGFYASPAGTHEAPIGPTAIPGGMAEYKGTTDKDVDPKELEMGIKVEYEHSDDLEKAKDIALDHLSEIKDYYTRLAKLEEEAKAAGTFDEEFSKKYEEEQKKRLETPKKEATKKIIAARTKEEIKKEIEDLQNKINELDNEFYNIPDTRIEVGKQYRINNRGTATVTKITSGEGRHNAVYYTFKRDKHPDRDIDKEYSEYIYDWTRKLDNGEIKIL